MQSEKFVITKKKNGDKVKVHAPVLRSESRDSFSVERDILHKESPVITPSLGNFVRNDLTSHVTGWPADFLERQANKFKQEAYRLGCLQYSGVSAELMCSRSQVRHTVIQATLQEQKVIYLRQQISKLEKLQSQNYYSTGEYLN